LDWGKPGQEERLSGKREKDGEIGCLRRPTEDSSKVARGKRKRTARREEHSQMSGLGRINNRERKRTRQRKNVRKNINGAHSGSSEVVHSGRG